MNAAMWRNLLLASKLCPTSISRAKMGARGRQAACARFDSRRMIHEYTRVFLLKDGGWCSLRSCQEPLSRNIPMILTRAAGATIPPVISATIAILPAEHTTHPADSMNSKAPAINRPSPIPPMSAAGSILSGLPPIFEKSSIPMKRPRSRSTMKARASGKVPWCSVMSQQTAQQTLLNRLGAPINPATTGGYVSSDALCLTRVTTRSARSRGERVEAFGTFITVHALAMPPQPCQSEAPSARDPANGKYELMPDA